MQLRLDGEAAARFLSRRMAHPWIHAGVHEPDLPRIAELLAFALRPGDVVALRGDLGAGKTTFARVILRVLLGDQEAEVPSPTFSLLQTYATTRFPVFHFDLYRLGSADEALELGLGEETATGVALIEWPERAEQFLPADRIEISITDDPAADPSKRRIVIEGLGACGPRIERLAVIEAFLRDTGWSDAHVLYLQGDASTRRYARLVRNGDSAILMDAPRQPDGPPIRDGKPYSRIANLAEDVRPYVAVAGELQKVGLSAPGIKAQDLDRGLLLTEDLGDEVFGASVLKGANQSDLWKPAVDVLVRMRRHPVPATMPLADGSAHRLPPMDRAALQIEVELLIDWYWPAIKGSPVPADSRADYLARWNALFDQLLALPTGWILRDFHSPNLMWLPQRTGLQRVGVLDFQDALEGNPAYDLVSLLQDARIDVPVEIEQELFQHYCTTAAATDPTFDEPSFRFAYSVLGAQRNTKILGIFTRLAHRDGKTQYLRHIPRIWGYLERDLEHATLQPLKAWYDSHFPQQGRTPPIAD